MGGAYTSFYVHAVATVHNIGCRKNRVGDRNSSGGVSVVTDFQVVRLRVGNAVIVNRTRAEEVCDEHAILVGRVTGASYRAVGEAETILAVWTLELAGRFLHIG